MSRSAVVLRFGRPNSDGWPVCAGSGREIVDQAMRSAVNRVELAELSDADEETSSPEEGRVPVWLTQVPYALVLSALAAGIVIVAAAYFKRGPAIIAGALLLAAAFRAFLPHDWVGMLAVRRRWVDLVTLITMAVLLIVLAWVAPQLSS
ncbi:DUF3017 domain-containing protein [Nocardiopsis lambiniae]